MNRLTARFAFPGDLNAPTGGYVYARRVMQEAAAFGVALDPLPLPGGFPHPDRADLDRAVRALADVPEGVPVLLDGLAGGALPPGALEGIGAPVVMLCHHPLALETGLAPERAEALRRSERAALAASRRVLATSRTTAALLRAEFGVPAHRLTVAAPGVDAPKTDAPKTDGATAERRPEPGRVNILSVGSLCPRKGHHLLIEALRPLVGGPWRLDIAGPPLDRGYERLLKRRIAAAGLSEQVGLSGVLAPQELEAAYAAADLFALASQYEGYGMAFAEAMARGLPVLGCPRGAVPEATLGAAELVPPGDLGPTLAALIADGDRRRRLADRCRLAARGFRRWPETARIVAEVLRKVAA